MWARQPPAQGLLPDIVLNRGKDVGWGGGRFETEVWAELASLAGNANVTPTTHVGHAIWHAPLAAAFSPRCCPLPA